MKKRTFFSYISSLYNLVGLRLRGVSASSLSNVPPLCSGVFIAPASEPFEARPASRSRPCHERGKPILVPFIQRDRRSRSPSTLNGNLSHPARSQAPPAA